MNPQTLKYLKQDEIGKVIAKGLAEVYMAKSNTPVKYLAQWLKNYSKNQTQLRGMVSKQQTKSTHLKSYQTSLETKKQQQEQKLKTEQTHHGKIGTFKQMIQNHQYQQELLLQEFPEFIEKTLGLTGVYIGQLNHPPKQVTDEDTDENAHLETTVPKLINYIGSSVSHKDLMRGQTLPLDKGVTGGAFALANQQEPPKQVEEGSEQVPVKSQPKYIYVPNVVREQKIHYFRLPKLGAYLAVPLVYNSYLSESVFDTAFAAKQQYLSELSQFDKHKHEQLQQMKGQLEEAEKKLHQLVQKNGAQSQTETIKEEIKEINERIDAKRQEKHQLNEAELPLQKREFVFCADNLGTDEQLNPKDIEFMVEMVEHFRRSWQEKEKQLLNKDVESQVTYTKSLSQPLQTTLQNIEKALTLGEQIAKEFEEIQNQTLKAYKQEQMEFTSLRTLAKQEERYCEAFLKLKQFRIVKYRKLIQHILHFLNYKKQEINIPGTAVLNWKLAKEKYITKQNYDRIFAYVVQGAKQGQYEAYCKVSPLSQYFNEGDIDSIFEYNIGLGIIAKFIQKALKHRISNVNWRKEQKEVQRKEREEMIVENQKINEQKAQALEKHRIGLPPDEVQTFNEEEWGAEYDKEHPLEELPGEVVDDIDNDI